MATIPWGVCQDVTLHIGPSRPPAGGTGAVAQPPGSGPRPPNSSLITRQGFEKSSVQTRAPARTRFHESGSSLFQRAIAFGAIATTRRRRRWIVFTSFARSVGLSRSARKRRAVASSTGRHLTAPEARATSLHGDGRSGTFSCRLDPGGETVT